MFARKNRKAIPRLITLMGLLGLAGRLALNQFFLDDRGMVPSMHLLTLAVAALMAGALGLAFYAARSIEGLEGYDKSFPASPAALLGHLLAAAGILVTVLTTQTGLRGTMALAWQLLAFASVVCLLAAGALRFQGKQPFFLLHLTPALFLLVHAIGNYQAWSSEPQMVNYTCALLGIISLTLFAFYHSAFDVGLEWRRRTTFAAYASVCLGLAAIPGNPYPWLYLGGSCWALLDRPIPWVRRRRPRPFAEETT